MLLYCDDISSMTDEQFDLFFGLMPIERQKKAMRYVRSEDKRLCVAAFALLGYALKLSGYKTGECEFARTEKGKPYIKNYPIHFSLSHTRDAVACSVSQSETGVDIQKKYVEYSRVVRRVCSKNEIDFISASKNPIDDFTKLWTLKESYVKCIGTGISDNLSDYDFSQIAQNGFGEVYGNEFSVYDFGEYVIGVCDSSPVNHAQKITIDELGII